MTNTKLLWIIIQDSGMKFQAIAEKMGLSDFGLRKKVDGATEFKASEIKRLCDILHIDDLQMREQIFFCTAVD